jgi:cysteine dioxygenase
VSQQELDQFAHISPCLPYTRNLIATDAQHYTILLLCWQAGKESKVHNHPCDGCFVKSIRGQVRETKYVETDAPVQEVGAATGDNASCPKRSMRVISDLVLSPGEVTYMDDFIGYHKVSNAAQESSEEFAITLHVYTPPYQSCRVWASPDNAEEFFTGTVCCYSEYGRVVCTAADKDKSSCSWSTWYI